MLYHDFAITEICRNLDWVELTRLLVVCKTLNRLVKEYAPVVDGPWHARYQYFTGLRVARFTGEPTDVFPPNVTELDLGDASNFNYESIPESVTTLYTFNVVKDAHLPPNLQKLYTGIADANNIACLKNLEYLVIEYVELPPLLPPNLTTLHIVNYHLDECFDNIWNILPKTLTDFSFYGNIQDVRMRDLPLSLKKLKLIIIEYVMNNDDYFNHGLTVLDTNIGHNELVPFDFSKLPISLISLSFTIYNRNTYIGKLTATIPRTIIHLSVVAKAVDEIFYKNLPPNLLSLSLNGTSELDLYPGLLPKSLTSLNTINILNVSLDDIGKFPPKMVHIFGVIMINNAKDGTKLDLRYLTNLRYLSIFTNNSNVQAILPYGIIRFHTDLQHNTLPNGVIKYDNQRYKLTVKDIENLPSSLEELSISVDIDDSAIYPPNLKRLWLSYNLSYENKLLLPKTLVTYMYNILQRGGNWELTRTIDGNVFIL